jgi:hypothetical protein
MVNWLEIGDKCEHACIRYVPLNVTGRFKIIYSTNRFVNSVKLLQCRVDECLPHYI